MYDFNSDQLELPMPLVSDQLELPFPDMSEPLQWESENEPLYDEFVDKAAEQWAYFNR